MYKDEVKKEYFEWLYDYICRGKFDRGISYKKLFAFLHSIEFRYSIPMDENRAHDGIDLRYRFAQVSDIDRNLLRGPCSVLEMMIAIAIRCEENIMDDTRYGNRTDQWFWSMINNLGLKGMWNDNFDEEEANRIIQRFLNRDYEPDGKGGLFTVPNCKRDLRDVEIWYQLQWYLDCII